MKFVRTNKKPFDLVLQVRRASSRARVPPLFIGMELCGYSRSACPALSLPRFSGIGYRVSGIGYRISSIGCDLLWIAGNACDTSPPCRWHRLRHTACPSLWVWQPFGPRQDGKECPAILTKKATPFGVAFLVRSLAMTYSHMGKPHTTIGDVPFHY